MAESPEKNGNGWEIWSKHVLNELERLDFQFEKLRQDYVDLKVHIAILKVKSGAWGVLGAVCTVGLSILIAMYFRK